MSLRFVSHILLKDTRRLWWMIALTIALLCRLVHFDALRASATPGFEEGWLNILLPLAWSMLIALVAMEDPVLGEAPFWATVPCRWPSLVAAKAVFIALFIHIPYFVGCAVTLQARGFAPSQCLADLFYRQFVLLALTLSSLALATMVRNVTQFMMIALVMATAIGAPSITTDTAGIRQLREILAFPIVIIAAVWIVAAQYATRRSQQSSAIGVAVLLIAATIWWAPREKFYSIQAALSPAPSAAAQPAIHLSTPRGTTRPDLIPLGPDALQIAIPIALSGPTTNHPARLLQVGISLEDTEGHSYSGHSNKNGSPTGPVVASLCCGRDFPNQQQLAVDRNLYDKIANTPVQVKGIALAAYYRSPNPAWISVGQNAPVINVGRCSSEITSPDNPNDEMLHIDCESPDTLPAINLSLTDPATDRNWSRILGDARSFVAYPRSTWLSPINRSGVFFQTTDAAHETANIIRWQIPREVIDSVRIGITPEIPDGFKIVHYEIPGISLSRYRVKP